MPSLQRTLPVSALLTFLAGCDLEALADSHSQKFTEDFHQTYAMKSGGRMELESFNGAVEIYGWDQDRVEINGTKYASTKEALGLIKVEITNTADSILIKTLRPERNEWTRHGNLGVKYRIHVPRKMQFDRLTSSNGALRLENLEGRGRFRTSNGPIDLISYSGDIDAQTSNGPIELDRFSGSAILHTSNGPITAKGVKGYLEAETSNGSIEVETAQLDPARPLKLVTSNGPIEVLLGSGGGPDVRANTSNGDISVRLPDGAGARVRAHTSNSSIKSDLPLNNVTSMSKTRMDGTIGAGGPLLELTTTNGHIRLAKN